METINHLQSISVMNLLGWVASRAKPSVSSLWRGMLVSAIKAGIARAGVVSEKAGYRISNRWNGAALSWSAVTGVMVYDIHP
jgi:hypothetical protein